MNSSTELQERLEREWMDREARAWSGTDGQQSIDWTMLLLLVLAFLAAAITS